MATVNPAATTDSTSEATIEDRFLNALAAFFSFQNGLVVAAVLLTFAGGASRGHDGVSLGSFGLSAVCVICATYLKGLELKRQARHVNTATKD